MDLAVLAVRLLVGGLLLGAGLVKLLAGRAAVKRAVEGYGLLPARLTRPFALALPLLELALGAVLVAGIWSRQSALLAGMLLATMTVAVASVLLRRLKADCGCFARSKQVSWRIVGRNTFLMLALSAVVVEGGGRISIDALPWIRVWAALLVAACLMAAAFLVRVREQEATS